MKRVFFIVITFLLVLTFTINLSLNQSDAENPLTAEDMELNDEMGLKWAEAFLSKMNELQERELPSHHKIHIAKYYAGDEVFNERSTEQDALRTVEEWDALVLYAQDHGYDPSDAEINEYIELMVEEAKQSESGFLDGIQKGLDITVEEYYTDIEGYSIEQRIIRNNIYNELKGETEALEDESPDDYHNRLVDQIDNIAQQYK